MVQRKITEFSTVTSALTTDLIPLVRAGEVNLDERNKKITVGNLIQTYNTSGFLNCAQDCPIINTGKVFEFYSGVTNLPLIVEIGFDINITSGSNSIELHRWNQEPNIDLNGKEWYADLPNTGGTILFTNSSEYRWISVFARNPNNSDQYDGVCFNVENNLITLVGF